MGALEDGKLFDIFVLDVYIGEEMGTALARDIRKLGIESPIIFATTSIEHAPESYETGTLRYLIKPINPTKFYEAMDAALLSAEKLGERLIKLKTENGVESINAGRIICSEAHDHYQYVALLGGTQLKVRLTVAELFAMLEKHGGFIRVGSPYIINLKHVKNLTRTEVLLYDGISVQIPRGKYNDIKNAFWDYQYDGGEN
jgi:DNA-binding LytR/AlgR family response regulator